MFESKDPDWRQRVSEIFSQANFVRDLGVCLVDLGPGWVESELTVEPRHMQQDGVVHAGVQATLADHSAGPLPARSRPPESQHSASNSRSSCSGLRSANACAAAPR